jgi:putative ABC transport system permease protein
VNFFDFKLAWWQLRGQRSRALLFISCVAIGVAARVSVGSFMGDVGRAVKSEARSLLTADLEVAGHAPLDEAKKKDLAGMAGLGARFQDRAEFLSVLSAMRRSRLCQVSAVEDGYPFYGKFRVQTEGQAGLNGAQPVAYVAPELLPQLGIRLGDSVKVGRLSMRVAGVMLEEPGLGGGAFSLGPKVLIGLSHLKATGLAGFGSRVNYDTLVALPSPELADPLAKALKERWRAKGDPSMPGPPPSDSLQISSFEDAEQTLQRFFVRLADFLNLASLMALLLGGIGVASVVRAFVREHMASIGVLRTLGASGGRIARVYLIQCLALGMLGSLCGAVLGTATQNMLPVLLKDFLPVALTFGVDLKSCGVGIGLGLLCSALFSLLPIAEIRLARPAQLFRDEAPDSGLGWRFWGLALAGAALFSLVGTLEAHSFKRGAGFVGALILGALLIWGLASWILPWMARNRFGGVGMRHGLSNLARPGLKPTASVIALGCAALHLGMLTIYQGSLLSELDPGKKPDEIPGLFLIDIQPDQVEGIRAFFHDRGKDKLVFSPMVKARYRGKLGEPAQAGDAVKPQGKGTRDEDAEDSERMRNREQNLSFRRDLGSGEKVVQGKWMDPDGQELEASLEEGFASRLGIRLGDRLDFDVQGVALEAKVTSLRKVHWASFQPNFFILLSPWALASAPSVTIASVAGLRDGEREALQTDLVEKFPNVTVFDVAEGSRKIMGIMDKISWAIKAVALFSLFTGLVVLAGIALSTARARQQEAALLKTLGGSSRVILASLGSEFGALGLLSGILGLGLSTLFGWVLLETSVEVPFRLPTGDLAFLLLSLTLVCAATGMLSSLKAIRAKPLAVLREE